MQSGAVASHPRRETSPGAPSHSDAADIAELKKERWNVRVQGGPGNRRQPGDRPGLRAKRLKAVLATAPRTSPVILVDGRGRPWNPTTFRNYVYTAKKAAGIEGLTFNDLRGTAVTRLSEAECTPQEIATITGHSLKNVSSILDRYLARTDKIALTAIAKLERAGQ